MKEYKNVWVFVETDKNGECLNVGLELLSPAKKISDKLEQDLFAIVIGSKTDIAIEELKEYGIKNIISVSSDVYTEYNTEVYEYTLSNLIDKYNPNTILFGATAIGRDLAPRVASRLDVGLTADCTELDFDKETGNVLWSRPALGGNLMAVIIAPETRPQMGTVRPGVFKKEKIDIDKKFNLIIENINVPDKIIKTRIIKEILLDELNSVNLEEAQIIVAGGRGLQDKKNFHLIEDLAKVLDAEVACSRPLVDDGWISRIHQVGQSGKTIAPKLYIAIGISGAIQHISGVSGADIIIAINSDENAPIFNIADYGIVGDLFEIVPMLIEQIKSYKKGG